MAPVHAIEIADGDDGAPRLFRNRTGSGDQQHLHPVSCPRQVVDRSDDAGMGHGLQHRGFRHMQPSLASVMPSATSSASMP